MFSTRHTLTLAVALWLVVSPLLLGYTSDRSAVDNGLWVALVAAVVVVAEGLERRLSALQAALGLWLGLSPLLFGYTTTAATIDHLACALALVVLTPASSAWRWRREDVAAGATMALPRRQLRDPW